MATSGSRRTLLPWTLAPVLAVVLLGFAISALPQRDCGAEGPFPDDRPERVLVIGVVGALALLLAGVAAARWAEIRRARKLTPPRQPVAVASLAVILLALALGFVPHLGTVVVIVLAAAVLMAAVSLLTMLAMLVQGWSVDRAGFWVPIHLATFGFFLVPLVGYVALAVSRTPICFE
jgi:hypothetical protein